MTHMCKQVAIVVLLAAGLYIGQVDPLIGNLQNILRYTFESFSSHIYNLKTDLKSKCISMSHLGGHLACVFLSGSWGNFNHWTGSRKRKESIFITDPVEPIQDWWEVSRECTCRRKPCHTKSRKNVLIRKCVSTPS